MERLALPVAAGLAVLAHLLFFLGLFGWLRRGPVIALVILVHLLAIPDWRGLVRWRPQAPVAALFLLALAPLFLLALYPPTGFDETLYHLPMARAFAETGGLPFLPDLRVPVFPPLNEMLFAGMLLLSGDVAAHLVQLLATLATAGLLAVWGQRLFPPAGGWIAASLFLGGPIVVHLAGTGYIEPGLTLFVTAALYSAWRFKETGKTGWLLAAALFAGSAAATKYLGLFFAAAVFVVVAWGAPRGRRLRNPLLYALASFAVLVPAYARIAAFTGNPIFPFLPGVFGASPWDPAHTVGAVSVGDAVIRLVRLPWNLVFDRVPVGWQPPFTPWLLAGLPLLAFGVARDSRVRRLALLPAVWAVVFLVLPADARYLLPALPVLCLAFAGSAVLLFPRLPTLALCAALFLPGWLYAGYRMVRQGPLPATAGERDHYLAEHLPLYPAVRFLNRSAGSGYTAFGAHTERMVYFAEGRLLGDYSSLARYDRILPALGDPEALHHSLEKLGAGYLLLNRDLVAALPDTPPWRRRFRRVYADGRGEVFVLVVAPPVGGGKSAPNRSRR